MPVTCFNCGAGFSLHVLPGSTTFCPKCRSQVLLGSAPMPARPSAPASVPVADANDNEAAAEQQLVKSLPAEKGRTLLKQVRTYLVETAR
jgi:hypothetical protein